MKGTQSISTSNASPLCVGMTGFEPATTRPPDEYSNRTELHPVCGCKSRNSFWKFQINSYFCVRKTLISGKNMQIRLTAPRLLRHETELPASKSISNRALIIKALAGGRDMPRHISDCDDTAVMLKALTDPDDPIDIKAAGTAMRFLTAYFAVKEGTCTLTGTARMKQRPIGILVDALRKLGAQIEYVEAEGFPPLRITGGHCHGGQLTLPGNVSSQYISALLMIGPVLADGLALELTGDIISRPYIALTLHLMADFGAQAEWSGDRHIRVYPVPYRSTPYYIEGDWSAASYWYEMMALTPDQEARVVLSGLSPGSYQGDAAVARLFEPLGVHTRFFQNAAPSTGWNRFSM